MSRAIVGVIPSGEHPRYTRLFEALERLFPISFEAREPGNWDGLSAVIFPSNERPIVDQAARRGLQCFVVQLGATKVVPNPAAELEFSRAESLSPVLRGQSLRDPEAGEFTPLTVQHGEQERVTQGGHVLWSHRPATLDSAAIDFSSRLLPALRPDSYLREVFNGDRFMELLPLIHFLQQVTRDRRLAPPPLRACFVFDDPNLRWRSYGCLNFKRLAEHARLRNYHATIGLIPLDYLWANAETATLFRENRQHLSLVMHGCRHQYLEMVCDYPEVEQLAMLALAIRRIQSFERRYGIQVCRVMESPYGVIGASMFKPLVALGFEAAMVTPLQFLAFNRTGSFPADLGCEPAGWMPCGLGLIPRIKMWCGWKVEAILAALMGQPIVIVGHHHDADNDLALLEEIATTINRTGAVRWCRPTEIARTNYSSRVEGNTLRILAAARLLQIRIPDGVREIQIERPWLAEGESMPLTVNCPEIGLMANQVCPGISAPINIGDAQSIKVISPGPEIVDPAKVPAPRLRLWPVIRRALTEARDRTYPYRRWRSKPRPSHGRATAPVRP